MAKVYDGDILAQISHFREGNEVFDRIIADVPSFIDRWPGTLGLGKMRDVVSACAEIAKNNLSDDGTITISATGVAAERWDEWMEAEGNTIFELVPNSTWTFYRPYGFVSRGNREIKFFAGRRDDWSYVRTYRKIGSSYTINRDAWPRYTHVPNQFADFPFPDSMNDVEISAFRAPVHHGLNEAKEFQKWMIKNNITWSSTFREDGVEVVTGLDDPGHTCGGYWIQFSPDPADWYHVPKTIYTHDGEGSGFDFTTVRKFDDNTRPGLQNIRGGANHNYVMLASWIVQTHTNVGDRILDPFCGRGSLVAASIINGRDIVGVEYNPERAANAKRVIKDLA